MVVYYVASRSFAYPCFKHHCQLCESLFESKKIGSVLGIFGKTILKNISRRLINRSMNHSTCYNHSLFFQKLAFAVEN